MRSEARRAIKEIKCRGHPRPFYVSFLVRDERLWDIKASFGGLLVDEHRRKRTCYCDVRVGSYRHDHMQDGGLNGDANENESLDYVDLPFGKHKTGVRHGLWRQAEVRYREAVEAFAVKNSSALTYLDRSRHLPSWQKVPAQEEVCWRALPAVDVEYWRKFVENASSMVCRYPEIKESHVRLEARNRISVFVNTEGSLIIQAKPLWNLSCYLWMLPSNGDALSWTLNKFVADPDELPSARRFRREMREHIETLQAVAASPALRSYSGPVLLDPVPAGLLLHEAFGHRLEGNRMLCEGEGQTFRDSLHQSILPPYLTVEDDPRLESFQGTSLVGHYRYDDEGVPAQTAELVSRGVLNEFLTSRAGIASKHRSNGHGRNECGEQTISRMAVTRVICEDGVSDQILKARLIDEVKRQGLPYGIRILSATGGETATESYNFQAFLGEINLAARVYPDGREELIRGIDFVGTPLNASRMIMAAGDRYEVDNAYCGAESGWVPVSTITPSLLVSHLELQAKAGTPYSPPCYPIPWHRQYSK